MVKKLKNLEDLDINHVEVYYNKNGVELLPKSPKGVKTGGSNPHLLYCDVQRWLWTHIRKSVLIQKELEGQLDVNAIVTPKGGLRRINLFGQLREERHFEQKLKLMAGIDRENKFDWLKFTKEDLVETECEHKWLCLVRCCCRNPQGRYCELCGLEE